jgi:hypothetical protein
MAIGEWFSEFCSNLQIKNEDTISTRAGAIAQRLNTDFWTTTSDSAHRLYVGSYGRNTAIEGISDLDLLFQLPYELYVRHNDHEGNGQSALLQLVRSSITKTYSKTSIRADGQVIQVPFSDGVTFEVVPAFINKDESYTFPDANDGGQWRTTNPRPEIAAIRDRNTECNGNLIRLCRMMRTWKGQWDVPIGGLLIDTLAYQFIEKYEYREKSFLYYDFMSRDFFRWMANQDKEQEWWKAPGSGQYVYGKELFQYKATRCYNLAVEAIDHDSATPKREWSAKQKWREIFGTTFPD